MVMHGEVVLNRHSGGLKGGGFNKVGKLFFTQRQNPAVGTDKACSHVPRSALQMSEEAAVRPS